MSLFNSMRRAASLLVEIPPENPAPSSDHDLDLSSDLSDLDSTSHGTEPNRLQAKTIDQIVRESDGPNLDEVALDEAAAVTTGGDLDFAAIYAAAKLPESSFSAEQMLEMVASLPSELPLETKRATVKAMLGTLGKNMGATPETIVTDASLKMAALEKYAGFIQRRTENTVAASQEQIAELEAQIEAHKIAMQSAQNELARVMSSCQDESNRLDDVLEFFSLDIGASKYAATQPTTDPELPPALNSSA